MAHLRKRRTATVTVKEESAEQDEEGSANKSSRRKRKLSDMLGPQWGKEELEHFYKAYRKYGKDWKKVAAAVHERTAEMVAALYNMNRAYLSLPDHVGSVDGFIAMMIDHYNILDASNSDGGYTESYEASQCSLQQAQLKNKLNNTYDFDGCHLSLLQLRSTTSSFGCSPPVKKRSGGCRARVIGKKIPWFHISYNIEKKSSETVPSCKEEPDFGSDVDCDPNEVAKADASALPGVSFQSASPRVSRTSTRQIQDEKYSSVHNGDLKGLSAGNKPGRSGAKLFVSRRIESSLEDGRESRVAGKRVSTKSNSSVLFRKSRRAGASSGKRGVGVKQENKHFTDMGAHEKNEKRSCFQQQKKRSRQLFSREGNVGLNALATLADLSLNGLLPPPIADSDSSVQFVEEKNENDTCEKAKMSEQQAGDDHIEIENPKISLERERGSDGSDAVKSVGLETKLKHHEELVSTELKGQHTTSLAEFKRRKRKAAVEKPLQLEALRESCFGETHKVEGQISFVYERKVRKRPKGMIYANVLLNNSKLVEPVGTHASDRETAVPSGCTSEFVNNNTAVNWAKLPLKHRRKQNMSAEKPSAEKTGPTENGMNIFVNACCESVNTSATFCPHTVAVEMAGTKVQLTHCLSSAKLRQWCIYEWFYSAIDLPWFEKNEFVEYLNHVGLGCVARLTRVEWGVIRSSLGKPRRLSKRFLQEEREKLEQYHESVRKYYNEVRAGTCHGFPTGLALPLSVGQRVIAVHPKTRGIHDGSILNVEHNRYRVQFDSPELGIGFVLDIDCMPVNPLENMPHTLTSKRVILDNLCRGFGDTKFDTKSWIGRNVGVDARAALDERLHNRGTGDTDGSLNKLNVTENKISTSIQQTMYNQPGASTQPQSREADIRALSDLTCALDKKEALLVELRHMNDDISTSQKNGEAVRNPEPFRKQYASVLLQLKVADDQVTSALVSLRQRNTYQVNTIPPQHCAISHSLGVGGSSSSERPTLPSLDISAQVEEIANNAKRKAKLMVDAAMQAVASARKGEDAVMKISVALDSVSNLHSGIHSGSTKVGLDSSQFDSGREETLECRQGSKDSFGTGLTEEVGPVVKGASSDRKERFLLAKLTASCVATFLMIQACSDRQFPPSEVAHVLESAVQKLQPHSTANLIIYREIQQYMGIVKNQILALIPTQPSISVSADTPPGSK